MTSPTRPAAAITAAAAAFPPIGALVNNAGVTSPTRFLDVTHEEWDRIVEANPRGSFPVTHRVAPGTAERGFGRIVSLPSVSAERGGGVFGGVAHSAEQAAIPGFARALARELGPSGITVNSVARDLIDTDITARPSGPLRAAAPAAHGSEAFSRRIFTASAVVPVFVSGIVRVPFPLFCSARRPPARH
ncbi:SDR family oxidoreductase [Streptomyces scabiei]|uniref:SDR family oxidoreductase n=1 Tax=Streptomyces scabiei TaxID=1930 RepID=UPI00298F4051|nr:SDR family oxidoreductase [Streptomyces scabiei]MDW8805083.1 SDR family oxidoreductase [Streptomyces scabiei]